MKQISVRMCLYWCLVFVMDYSESNGLETGFGFHKQNNVSAGVIDAKSIDQAGHSDGKSSVDFSDCERFGGEMWECIKDTFAGHGLLYLRNLSLREHGRSIGNRLFDLASDYSMEYLSNYIFKSRIGGRWLEAGKKFIGDDALKKLGEDVDNDQVVSSSSRGHKHAKKKARKLIKKFILLTIGAIALLLIKAKMILSMFQTIALTKLIITVISYVIAITFRNIWEIIQEKKHSKLKEQEEKATLDAALYEYPALDKYNNNNDYYAGETNEQDSQEGYASSWVKNYLPADFNPFQHLMTSSSTTKPWSKLRPLRFKHKSAEYS